MSTPTDHPGEKREWVVEFDDREAVAELRLALNDFQWESRQSRQREQANLDFAYLLVDAFAGLRIEVRLNEHAPPHFHVNGNGESASYRISDCEQIDGGLRRYHGTIKTWHAKNKPKIIEKWNESRPSDCPVGPYREG